MYYIGFFRDSRKMLLFQDRKVPTLSRYRYFDHVMGPFFREEDALYEMRELRRKYGYTMNPYRSRARYCRKRQKLPRLFDKRSFRTIALGKSGKKGVIACPKGKWDASKEKCRVGTRLESILYPVGQDGCTESGMELNPYTRTGLYYPKKGSKEAYEWAERMREAKLRKSAR